MHATIQKPIAEIQSHIKPQERVFVVGCNNCAMKCHSGGEAESAEMASRLRERGVDVVGHAVPGPQGMSLCKLSNTRKVLQEDYADQVKEVDSFLVLACGQGVHTVLDAMEGAMIHVGCDTLFGGETVSDSDIQEFCSLCGDCVVEYTGGLCPVTLCSKSLLNGPCGGAENGKCEVDPEKPCGWILIYDRLKNLGRLELLDPYREPKNNSRRSSPRNLSVSPAEAVFHSPAGKIAVCNTD